jgi:hypothetical protein
LYIGSQPPAEQKQPVVQQTTSSVSTTPTLITSRQAISNASPAVTTIAAVLPTSHVVSTDISRPSVQQQQQQQVRTAGSSDLTSAPKTVQFSNTAASETARKSESTPAMQPRRDQQLELQKQAPVSILKKQPNEPLVIDTSSQQPVSQAPGNKTQQQHHELNSALAELDSIAATTRQLSKSLSFPSMSPHHLQVSPTSSSSHLHASSQSPEPSSPDPGHRSIISTVTAALDAKLHGKTTVHPKLSALHETRSLDRSGIARRQLEQLTHPGAGGTSLSTSGTGIHKTVTLRKPRPLRKAQTVSLTSLGLGVDPDLMSFLASRKEKSASDDEDQKTPSPR